MRDDRQKIFARIREGLSMKSPRHHDAPSHGGQPGGAAPDTFRKWLPAVGSEADQQLALFAKQSEMLKTEFVQCKDGAAAAAHLAKLAGENGWKRLAYHDGSLIAKIMPHLPADLKPFQVAEGYDRDVLESCEAGLTECECLVAQTGSVCVTSRSSGGRALSVYPPHHIVVASREQLVADLSDAYTLLASKYNGQYPSMISFISGPSRTGDIERILVLGAHGPKKLTVLLLD